MTYMTKLIKYVHNTITFGIFVFPIIYMLTNSINYNNPFVQIQLCVTCLSYFNAIYKPCKNENNIQYNEKGRVKLNSNEYIVV